MQRNGLGSHFVSEWCWKVALSHFPSASEWRNEFAEIRVPATGSWLGGVCISISKFGSEVCLGGQVSRRASGICLA